jgi:multiple sugar transport system permease protein
VALRKAGTAAGIILALGAVVMLFPVAWMLASSFKSNRELLLSIPPTFFPLHFSLEGYTKVVTGTPFLRWTVNSLWVAACTTAAVVLTSSLAGYVFAKFTFPLKRVAFLVVLATMMIPFEVVMIPTYLVILRLGLMNTLSGLIVPSLVSAFGIFMCRQFCESMPSDLMDAGRIDGSGELMIFARIVVPEIGPAMSALTIFTFMATWNNYAWPLIVINDVLKMPVSLAISYFNGIHPTHPSYVIAAAVLILVPVMVVYLVFQRRFMEGLALTGLK